MQKNQKKLMTHSGEKLWTDEQMDRRTGRLVSIYRTSPKETKWKNTAIKFDMVIWKHFIKNGEFW